VQRRHGARLAGPLADDDYRKSFETTGPTGPWLVTADEIRDPHDLELRLFVNGELRQEESTADMVHDIYHQIEHLSTAFTLEPGDLIATGTPSGVGVAMNPPGTSRPATSCGPKFQALATSKTVSSRSRPMHDTIRIRMRSGRLRLQVARPDHRRIGHSAACGPDRDQFPLHLDAEAARATPYGQRVAHGTLTLSIAMDSSSTPTLPRAEDFVRVRRVRFRKPVFIGDTISLQVEVTRSEMDPARRTCAA